MLQLAYQTITWRDDFAAALSDISQAGYTGYETFSFPPNATDSWPGYVDRLARAYTERPGTYLQTNSYSSPEGIVELGNHYGLRLTSMYCSGRFIDPEINDAEIEAILNAARFLKEAGCEHLILGGGMNLDETYSNSDYELFFETVQKIGMGCLKEGVTACYHPHSGTMIETAEQLSSFCMETDPALIALAPDVAHLIRGGADPAQTIYKYADRIKYLHLKDIKDNEFLELGEGTINLAEIVRALIETGYSGWAVVELDDATGSPLESAIKSRRFLEQTIDDCTN
ncbi:MAG: TIM barrel protein [Candidatus Latescibacteria bacterium]|nr:TIM barrel protein [Candidatus Latescibacterota bacterium]